MRSNPTRQILPLALLASLCACSAQVSTDEDGTEQEQALSSAQQAAETAATPAPAPVAGVEPPVPACDASQAEALVGQPVSDALAEQAREDAGAERVRVLTPGQMVTMDFDEERLNIEVDAAGTITALRCG